MTMGGVCEKEQVSTALFLLAGNTQELPLILNRVPSGYWDPCQEARSEAGMRSGPLGVSKTRRQAMTGEEKARFRL